VTLAAGALKHAGLIEYHRGRVTILDRAGLEDAACPSYEHVRLAYSRLVKLSRVEPDPLRSLSD